jgi:hypothetical protein
LNLLQIENAKYYAVESNDIWFCHEPPDTTESGRTLLICGGVYIDRLSYSYHEGFLITIKKKALLLWESAGIIIIGFSVFLVVAICRLFIVR